MHFRKKHILVLCLIIGFAIAAPLSTFAKEADKKVVRVGWFESTFCYRDQYGDRRGIAYEYQQKIAAHTGWTYEYVEDSWPNLLQMLINGEIDLLSDVSYTKERSVLMLYSSLAMGEESYYLYIDTNNSEISSDDLQTLNKKRVGVNKGSFQVGLLKKWAKKSDLSIDIVELTVDEADAMNMLTNGEIDAFVSMDSFGASEEVYPVAKIGVSEYFFAVNNNRPDLLEELNSAMLAIQDEDPYFNQRMFDEYVQLSKKNALLSPALEKWLKDHGTIRVGYWDNYLPFCAADPKTGALTGALKDYLAHASTCLQNAKIKFEAVPYPSTNDAIIAMKHGEVDCVFPINISSYYGESTGVMMTNPIMETEMGVLTRSEDRPDISPDNALTVAIDEGNINFKTFVKKELPNWNIVTYPSVEECCSAVANEEADAALVCNYRMGEYELLKTKYKLVDLPAGGTMGLSFAVKNDSTDLYSILNKLSGLTSAEEIEYDLVSYMYQNQKTSLMVFLKDNWIVVIISISIIFFIILFLLIQRMKAERKANKQQRQLEEAAELAKLQQTITSLLNNMPGMNFTKDAESGKYLACNQAFAEYAHRQSPDEVIGLTDRELFDGATARQFAKDDSMALSMDEPYIFFEDVPDDSGNFRQFKTTRAKYTDASGRLCVLGVSIDVTTDTIHIHREDAATKEDYEKARSTGIIFAHIAQALARGYSDLYYINLNSEQFIEYRSSTDDDSLTEVRRGWHFFELCQEDIERIVYPEDQDAVKKALDRKTLEAALDQGNTFMMTYRLKGENGPTYVRTKITRMKDDDRYIIMGVTDVNEEMKQRSMTSRMKEEMVAYNRLRALAGEFLSIYLVVPETGLYREFTAATNYKTIARSQEGTDFFKDSKRDIVDVIYPEDLNRFLSTFTKENVLGDIEKNGIFTLSYRLIMEGLPRYVQLKAALVEEPEGSRLIIGIYDIDNQVRQEEIYVRNLAQAQKSASIDALTSVKNRHAYLLAEERLNTQIARNQAPPFAIVILDLNDLKYVNDNIGHDAGDQFIRDACKIICNTFKHSPVFRIGGDEFAVISQGDDYACIDELMMIMADHNTQALMDGGIVIACGMSKYDNDDSVASVFERADQKMYKNKSDLKDKKQKR